MKTSLATLTVFLHYLIFLPTLLAQDDSGFMYGKVVTKSGNTYVGQIRWGSEEIFWNDIFNSVKTYGSQSISHRANSNDMISERSREETKWELLKIWDDKYTGTTHQFTCRFGDIKELIPYPNGNVDIVFKDNRKTRVNGGSNDIFTDVTVVDYELGPVTLSWKNLGKVEFFDAPSQIKNKPGNPLYGSVTTTSGTFRGFVQWDHDERIDTDVLDGDLNGNRLKIVFSDIDCIARSGCSSIVTHTNGNKFKLTGTNDVDCGNRGIIISASGVGKIEVPWRQFSGVCFEKNVPGSGEPYRSYPRPKRLYASVKKLDGTEEKGIVIFDNDEGWDYEHLEGILNGIKYIIPFRNIASISPKNNDYSNVVLKTGERLLLGESRDVSYQNNGVFVFKDYEEKPLKIEWSNIDLISFE